MALRLHRVTDDQWKRLAAARRVADLPSAPPRAAIGAIESQLLSLDRRPAISEPDEPREAATG